MESIRLLKEGEAARVLGVNRLTLTKWRKLGIAPPFRKIGNRIYYVQHTLEHFFLDNLNKGENCENC